MLYGYMIENKSLISGLNTDIFTIFESEWKSFNSVFSTLNESVITEGINIKGILSKIGEAIKWIKGKLKEILSKVKEKIRTFIMDDEDFKYNFKQINDVYKKIMDDKIHGNADKDIKDYIFDIKIHKKSIKVQPLWVNTDDYENFDKKQYNAYFGSDSKKADIVTYSVYIGDEKRDYRHNDDIFWGVDDRNYSELGLSSNKEDRDYKEIHKKYGWKYDKNDDSEKIQNLRKNVENACIKENERYKLNAIFTGGALSSNKFIFSSYNLSNYEEQDKKLNDILDKLEKEYHSITTEEYEDVDYEQAMRLASDIKYIKEIISLNNKMLSLYIECNHKNAMECWKLVFKLVRPANGFKGSIKDLLSK